MFTPNHFIWLAICAVLVITMSIISIKFKFSFKTCATIMCITSIISELINMFTNIVPVSNGVGSYLDQAEMPLHMCSIFVFIYISLPFLKESKLKETLKSYAAVIGLLGPIFAILIPTIGTSFTMINTYQYFIYHAAMIYFAIYLIFTGQANLKLKAYAYNLLILFALSIIMIWVNSALSIYNTNFFFIVRPPMENLPILNLNNGWHAYYFTLVAIAIVLITIVHLPFLIKQLIDYKKIKKAKHA